MKNKFSEDEMKEKYSERGNKVEDQIFIKTNQ